MTSVVAIASDKPLTLIPMNTNARIQELVNQRRYAQAERLIEEIQEKNITPYQLNSAKGLAAIRGGR